MLCIAKQSVGLSKAKALLSGCNSKGLGRSPLPGGLAQRPGQIKDYYVVLRTRSGARNYRTRAPARNSGDYYVVPLIIHVCAHAKRALTLISLQ